MEQLTLDFWSGKMSPERSAAIKEPTSRRSSRKSSASSSRKPPVLMCLQKAGALGEDSATWTEDGAWLGECMTRNTGESPSAVVESRLSQILEATPHPKYYLTAKACQGILRRAERRGKDLPKPLKAVLIRQSQGVSPQERTEAPAPTEAPTSYAVRIRGGCDGGGKGALVQTEKSGTLGTGNDQTIFCLATQQGGAELRTDDRAPTLTAAAGMSGNNQPVVAIPINDKATRWQGGGESRNHDGSGNGLGIGKEGDPSPTLTAGDRHGVMCLTTGSYMQVEEEISPTTMARDYKGFNVVCYGIGRDTFNQGQNMAVRRLTPTEGERLQGFPDGWTDIGDWVDGKGKKHKSADSPRYKALGNSIALPFWQWMLRRMCEISGARTMGSLFDGIGGFPLCWERINGDGSCRWASEIEEFPIAVTKRHFKEE